MSVDEFHSPVACEAFVRKIGEPLELIVRQLPLGVFDACTGHPAEPKGCIPGDGGVVISHHRRHVPRSQLVDAVSRPGIVADHVAGTEEVVDRRHVLEDGLQCDPVAVDVRDESDLHART